MPRSRSTGRSPQRTKRDAQRNHASCAAAPVQVPGGPLRRPPSRLPSTAATVLVSVAYPHATVASVPRLAQVRTLRTAQQFLEHLAALGIALPFDADMRADGPLAAPLDVFDRTAGNRFAILPMEGWDGTDDG